MLRTQNSFFGSVGIVKLPERVLAREFSVTKPTISDAIKVLEQKGLIRRMDDSMDNRRYSIALTTAGKKVVVSTEDLTMPFTQWVAQTDIIFALPT